MIDQIDCACLIHDVAYDWSYVERLYNGLRRNLTPEVRLHVYTEKNRAVPSHMIHHGLEEWDGIKGPKKSWWYKIQLFNSNLYQGPLFYLDLDTVICGNLDWIHQLPLDQLWAARDFKYLFRPGKITINSSVMWFDTGKFNHIYREFDAKQAIKKQSNGYGDQDYILEKLLPRTWACFDTDRVKSWRWELYDGGFDFRRRKHFKPGAGTNIPDSTSIMVFHGHPKPHECNDPNVLQHWN